MSFNRENVTWQSENGTWNLGFFQCLEMLTGCDEDFDPEWDVEYNYSCFSWVSRGHATEDAAMNSWKGANPGGSEICPFNEGNRKECEAYDKMAVEFIERNKPATSATFSYRPRFR